jgi:hypothetical protein
METPTAATPTAALTKSQRFYQKHKAEIAERNKELVKCECGTFITRNNMAKHRKTQTHMLKAKIIKIEFVDDDEVE